MLPLLRAEEEKEREDRELSSVARKERASLSARDFFRRKRKNVSEKKQPESSFALASLARRRIDSIIFFSAIVLLSSFFFSRAHKGHGRALSLAPALARLRWYRPSPKRWR